MLQEKESFQPETLFNTVLRFVSINAENIHSLIGFPAIVGKKLFDQFIQLNEHAILPSSYQKKILSCFKEAYKDLILDSITLSHNLIIFNEYFDSFSILFEFLNELCLCSCYLGDTHELFEHLHNFSLYDIFTKLKKLCLKKNCLKNGAIRKITLPIRMFNRGPKNLEFLDLSENEFTDDIIPGLAVFQKLQCLDLSGSCLSNKSIQDLEKNCSLKLSPSENTMHLFDTKGWAVPLIQKWHDVCTLRRKNRDIMKQSLYYSKKRFLMAKKSIADSPNRNHFSSLKLVFKRIPVIKENIIQKFTDSIAPEALSETAALSHQKAIEDIFAQYV